MKRFLMALLVPIQARPRGQPSQRPWTAFYTWFSLACLCLGIWGACDPLAWGLGLALHIALLPGAKSLLGQQRVCLHGCHHLLSEAEVYEEKCCMSLHVHCTGF